MLAKLTCKSGSLAGNVYYIQDEAVIGNNPENAVYLRSGVVSGRHVRIFFDRKKKSFFIEDMKSFNGTTLDGEGVRGKRRMRTYHVIRLANTFEFVFQLAREEEAAPEAAPADIPAIPVEDRMARTILLNTDDLSRVSEQPVHQEYLMEFKTAKGGKQAAMLKQGDNMIGRASGCGIQIDNPSISRHHAVITVRNGSVKLKDSGSRNGTYVAETKISSEVEITPESDIRFGLINAVLVRQISDTVN
jgi:pSer/pThr/pTyr-binding forkhead associated (FHA) protein